MFPICVRNVPYTSVCCGFKNWQILTGCLCLVKSVMDVVEVGLFLKWNMVGGNNTTTEYPKLEGTQRGYFSIFWMQIDGLCKSSNDAFRLSAPNVHTPVDWIIYTMNI